MINTDAASRSSDPTSHRKPPDGDGFTLSSFSIGRRPVPPPALRCPRAVSHSEPVSVHVTQFFPAEYAMIRGPPTARCWLQCSSWQWSYAIPDLLLSSCMDKRVQRIVCKPRTKQNDRQESRISRGLRGRGLLVLFLLKGSAVKKIGIPVNHLCKRGRLPALTNNVPAATRLPSA